MMNYLRGLALKAENITIITKPVSEHKDTESEVVKELLDQLILSGFIVIQCANAHQKFIIIDEQIV